MKKLFILALGLILFASCKKSTSQESAIMPTDDTSMFVTLTDAVPDAILEIRYFGTYNFVGDRIDGYLGSVANY